MEHAAWRAQAAAFRQPQPAAPADGFPTPQQVIETLARLTPDNAQIVTDVGQHQMWTAQYYPFEQAPHLHHLRRARRDGLWPQGHQ